MGLPCNYGGKFSISFHHSVSHFISHNFFSVHSIAYFVDEAHFVLLFLEHIEEEYIFLSKMVYHGKVLDIGAELPLIKL